jgi:hypothetical protein
MAATRKKPAPKKAPPAKKRGERREQARREVKGQKEPGGGTEPSTAPKGARLTAAAQQVRDTLMIQRLAQGWDYHAIAAEAGISVSAAKRAIKARQEAAPLRLNADPVEVIERIFEGYQLSVGDLEAMAAEAQKKGQLSAAVGAKKAANEARDRMVAVLQATGRLPQELGALRHLIDLRAVAVRMNDTMDEFDEQMRAAGKVKSEAERKRMVAEAAAKVRTTFDQLLGIEDDEDVYEGTAAEIPAEAAA